ncbi:7-cyano-7-deazaguanine reductase [Haemophilus influenzae 22.4-21]|uniref:7-cyano-7-deazaguanine reductase n=1 Tax=Haemophilus influenzae 22.4-21 TaxID=375063 RepID=A4NYK9_HAEIF|nr:7-cyano-7-deazaguanine reductase [Haemophilus influenzae 22.4-21]
MTSLLLIFTVLSACSREKNSCRVVKISDGDTLTCLTKGNKSIKVRLAEIDAPEKSQAFGQKSKKPCLIWFIKKRTSFTKRKRSLSTNLGDCLLSR